MVEGTSKRCKWCVNATQLSTFSVRQRITAALQRCIVLRVQVFWVVRVFGAATGAETVAWGLFIGSIGAVENVNFACVTHIFCRQLDCLGLVLFGKIHVVRTVSLLGAKREGGGRQLRGQRHFPTGTLRLNRGVINISCRSNGHFGLMRLRKKLSFIRVAFSLVERPLRLRLFPGIELHPCGFQRLVVSGTRVVILPHYALVFFREIRLHVLVTGRLSKGERGLRRLIGQRLVPTGPCLVIRAWSRRVIVLHNPRSMRLYGTLPIRRNISSGAWSLHDASQQQQQQQQQPQPSRIARRRNKHARTHPHPHAPAHTHTHTARKELSGRLAATSRPPVLAPTRSLPFARPI